MIELATQKSFNSLFLKWIYWLSGNDYRVDSLSKKYLNLVKF